MICVKNFLFFFAFSLEKLGWFQKIVLSLCRNFEVCRIK